MGVIKLHDMGPEGRLSEQNTGKRRTQNTGEGGTICWRVLRLPGVVLPGSASSARALRRGNQPGRHLSASPRGPGWHHPEDCSALPSEFPRIFSPPHAEGPRLHISRAPFYRDDFCLPPAWPVRIGARSSGAVGGSWRVLITRTASTRCPDQKRAGQLSAANAPGRNMTSRGLNIGAAKQYLRGRCFT